MIVLDTNVVSEPMKASGNPAVKAWLDRQAGDTLYLTATSLAELLVGIEMLPTGKRRAGLNAALVDLVSRLFPSRILPFDESAARVYANLVTRARADGRAISVADGQIAAIASVNGFSVATKDAGPFIAVGIQVINPVDAAGERRS